MRSSPSSSETPEAGTGTPVYKGASPLCQPTAHGPRPTAHRLQQPASSVPPPAYSRPKGASSRLAAMAVMSVTTLPAHEIARLVTRREVSPVEIVDAHLERIEALNPSLNAFVYVDAEGARRAARSAEEAVRRGDPLGPLHGVPLSIKSSISVAGMPWETGSPLRRGVRGDRDATLVRRAREAGAIVLGVTNVAESLMAWETDNALYGRTSNPWDPTRTPGGSSGGESAAIAAGLSAGGIGSDGGGSIRVPAHFSGIVGLKPTPGRMPATGHFPPCGGPFALTGVVGPMARTVDDVQLLLSVMAGPDIGDPNGHPVALDPQAGGWRLEAGGALTYVGQGFSPAHIRVGWFDDDGRTPVEPAIRDAVRRAADALSRAGFDVVPFRPEGLDEARELWWEIFGRASRLLLEPMVAGHEDEVHPNLPEFLAWTRQAPKLTAERLLEVEIARDVLRTRVLEQMAEVPVLLCPVSAVSAFRHGERAWTIEGRQVRYLDAWSYTAWFNLLQNPAVAVPAGLTPDGLPVGVQVVARHWEEMTALAVAREIERALGGYHAPTGSSLQPPAASHLRNGH
jgi:Asp-tRNA(Asn)/Glu-tRNA(Gln) amidotransferase A subunit family amidase